MKRKQRFSVLALAAIGMCTLGSCTKDYYDENYNKELYNANWNKYFGEIDPNQTWNTASQVTANILVNEDTGETYTVKIYTDNPLDENATAYLLATTEVKSGEAKTMSFDVPTTITTLYACRVDSHKRRLLKIVSREDNNTYNIVFGDNTASTKAMSRAATTDAIASPYTTDQIENFIAGGKNLNDNKINNIGAERGTYYVPKGKT